MDVFMNGNRWSSRASDEQCLLGCHSTAIAMSLKVCRAFGCAALLLYVKHFKIEHYRLMHLHSNICYLHLDIYWYRYIASIYWISNEKKVIIDKFKVTNDDQIRATELTYQSYVDMIMNQKPLERFWWGSGARAISVAQRIARISEYAEAVGLEQAMFVSPTPLWKHICRLCPCRFSPFHFGDLGRHRLHSHPPAARALGIVKSFVASVTNSDITAACGAPVAEHDASTDESVHLLSALSRYLILHNGRSKSTRAALVASCDPVSSWDNKQMKNVLRIGQHVCNGAITVTWSK